MGEPGSFRVLIGRGKEAARDHIGTHRRLLARRVVEEVKTLTTSPQDVAAARRALPLLIERGLSPTLAGLIQAEADTILGDHGAKVTSRRKAALWIAGIATAGTLGGTVVLATVSAISEYNSPEAVARRKVEADAKAAAEFKKDQELEKNNTLDKRRSADTYLGWSIAYFPKIGGMRWELIGSSRPLTPGGVIELPTGIIGDKTSTGIVVKDHIRTTDGVRVTRFAIMDYNSRIREEWIARTEESDEIDINKFLLKKGSEYQTASIERAKTIGNQTPTFQINVFIRTN